jgi:hypothetical protein
VYKQLRFQTDRHTDTRTHKWPFTQENFWSHSEVKKLWCSIGQNGHPHVCALTHYIVSWQRVEPHLLILYSTLAHYMYVQFSFWHCQKSLLNAACGVWCLTRHHSLSFHRRFAKFLTGPRMDPQSVLTFKPPLFCNAFGMERHIWNPRLRLVNDAA